MKYIKGFLTCPGALAKRPVACWQFGGFPSGGAPEMLAKRAEDSEWHF
jgi:hypothetical protein